MAYIKQTWQNNPPSTATPITAERLDHLETQYDEALAQVAADIADPDSDIGTELTATIGELAGIKPNTWSTIGDSISARAGVVTNSTGGKDMRDLSWQFWANCYLAQRLEPVVDYAIGGKWTTHMITEQLPQVLAAPTTYCTVLGGTNDIGNSTPSASVIANLEIIIDTLVAAGIRPIVGELTPRGDLNPTAYGELQKVNAWIRQVAPRHGAWIVSWFAAMSDANGVPRPDVHLDGLHPTAYGAEIMGRKFAQAVDGLIPAVDRLPSSNAESPGVVIASNPMMTGTGGTISTGGTGEVAASWKVGAWSGDTFAASLSKVPRTDDVLSDWQQIEVTDSASAQMYQIVSTTSRWATGDQFEVFMEIEADPDLDAPTGFEVWAFCQPSGRVSAAFAVADAGTRKAVPHAGVLSAPPVVRVPPVTVPEGTTQIWALVRVKGDSGTLRVGRVALQKVRT